MYNDIFYDDLLDYINVDILSKLTDKQKEEIINNLSIY